MTSTTDHQPGLIRDLTERECWQHLSEQAVGRVAYVDGRGPVVVPINYVARDGKIWLRTASYNQLATHLPGSPAAFEIDQIDPHDHTGWSVLVRGRATHVIDPRTTPPWPEPVPWPEGLRTMVLCLTPQDVAGRVLQQGSVTPPPGRGPGSIQRTATSGSHGP